MSAYIVGKSHIDALIRFGIAMKAYLWWDGQGIYINHENAHELGRELWMENLESVKYRYPEDKPDNRCGPICKNIDLEIGQYRYTSTYIPLFSAAEILKALRGLSYQSCEHPGWESSKAFAIVKAIETAAIYALPGFDELDTWEIKLYQLHEREVKENAKRAAENRILDQLIGSEVA